MHWLIQVDFWDSLMEEREIGLQYNSVPVKQLEVYIIRYKFTNTLTDSSEQIKKKIKKGLVNKKITMDR